MCDDAREATEPRAPQGRRRRPRWRRRNFGRRRASGATWAGAAQEGVVQSDGAIGCSLRATTPQGREGCAPQGQPPGGGPGGRCSVGAVVERRGDECTSPPGDASRKERWHRADGGRAGERGRRGEVCDDAREATEPRAPQGRRRRPRWRRRNFGRRRASGATWAGAAQEGVVQSDGAIGCSLRATTPQGREGCAPRGQPPGGRPRRPMQHWSHRWATKGRVLSPSLRCPPQGAAAPG